MLDGTGSVYGNNGWHLVVLGQHGAILATGCYLVVLGHYGTVLFGTWSVLGAIGWYLVELGQYGVVVAGTWCYRVSILLKTI